MEIEKLKQWAASLEVEVQTIRDQIQLLSGEQQRKTQQIDLIRRLLDSADLSNSRSVEGVRDPDAAAASLRAATPSQVKDHVYAILAELKRPMNINEIHAEFRRRGYIIPGKGTAFNILVHIGRELKLGKKARFYRAGRGTYALRNHQPNKKL